MRIWHGNLAMTRRLYNDTWEKTVELFTYDLSSGDKSDICEECH